MGATATRITVDEYHANRPPDLYGYPDRVPDLCVEIRSPGTWRYDIGAKKAGYERAGLPELWLVDDAARCVLVLRRSGPDAPRFDVSLELARATMSARRSCRVSRSRSRSCSASRRASGLSGRPG